MPWIGKLKSNLISDTLPITNNLLPQNSTHLAATVLGKQKHAVWKLAHPTRLVLAFSLPFLYPLSFTISLFSISVCLSLCFIISLLYPVSTLLYVIISSTFLLFSHFLYLFSFLLSFLPFFLFIFYVGLILSLFFTNFFHQFVPAPFSRLITEDRLW